MAKSRRFYMFYNDPYERTVMNNQELAQYHLREMSKKWMELSPETTDKALMSYMIHLDSFLETIHNEIFDKKFTIED